LSIPEVFQVLVFFFRFWNICTYTIRYLQERTQVETDFIHVSYTAYVHSLKVVLYNIFRVPVIFGGGGGSGGGGGGVCVCVCMCIGAPGLELFIHLLLPPECWDNCWLCL
jgi:hypothetical protein